LTRSVTISPEAAADLVAARRWLLQPGSGQVALRRLRNIRSSIRALRQAPCFWAIGDHPDIREIPVEGYRVLFIVEPDTGSNDTAGDVTALRLFGPWQERIGYRRRTSVRLNQR
jgi:plasmid stabilization system protein ParE